MNLASLRLLQSPEGQDALISAQSLDPLEADFLRHFTGLSRRYPPDLARTALETAVLRKEGAAKFPFAERMYFTREALEQATPQEVSAYRAGRYRSFERVVDLGCSIGGDTLSLAAAAPTTGLDLDRLRLELARLNLAALGLEDRASFLQADLASPLPFAPHASTALFFDPARRSAGRRIFSVRDYHPPLEIVHTWLERFPSAGVKVSPGVNLDELAGFPAEIEFISLRGELKEAALWFGSLKSAERRATLLPGPFTLVSEPGRTIERRLSEPRRFIYEPDPAVLRAGLVLNLGERLNAAQLDPEIAYLTVDETQKTPFARCWEVEAWFPFQLKRLRAYLRARGVGLITVKKRGSPLQPEALIRDLRLKGEGERVVFLTQLRGQPVVIVAYPYLPGRGVEAATLPE